MSPQRHEELQALLLHDGPWHVSRSLNSEFTFSKIGCPTKARVYSALLFIHCWIGREEMNLWPSQVWIETLIASFGIWNSLTDSIFCINNHYTAHVRRENIANTFLYYSVLIQIFVSKEFFFGLFLYGNLSWKLKVISFRRTKKNILKVFTLSNLIFSFVLKAHISLQNIYIYIYIWYGSN